MACLSVATVIMLLSVCVSSSADERLRRDALDDDAFPEFSLPKLSRDKTGGKSSDSQPLPVVEDLPPLDSEAGRGSRVSGSRSSGGLVPLDPLSRDFSDEERSVLPRSRFVPGRDDAERRTLPQLDELAAADDGAFDWRQQPVSVADIETGRAWPFEHGKPKLNETETEAYAGLVRAVMDRRSLTAIQLPETMSVISAWETAFYRFADVRRQAWENGKIRLQRRSTAPADPFSHIPSTMISSTDRRFDEFEPQSYSLSVDMQSQPSDFVGRPVVLYGLFTPSGKVELQARRTLEGEEHLFSLQRGALRNLRNTETVAILDAMSYVDPQTQDQPSTAWPVDKRVAIPVLVKGWFVKLWGQQPLLFTDVVRILTPRPYDELIREQVRSRRKVSEDESWLYYETLRQMQVTSSEIQTAVALAEQQSRVKQLLQQLRLKAASDRLVLDNDLRIGKIPKNDEGSVEGYETRRRRLSRQMDLRVQRYLNFQQQPESFPIFVDVFQNPEFWQGRLVTLRGHVRRITTSKGDSAMFDGQPVHELWLFTDDSQQNPAVIVTPALPPDFPVSSNLIDSVTVTGCFFKMYVYRSQQDNRLAPLLLAGHVSWNPTPDHVLTLAKEGHIPAHAGIVKNARANEWRVSDTLVLVLGFLSLLAAMTVWGRVQRDRRERQRLMSLVDERPDFRQTSPELFSGPFAESRIEPTRG